MAQRSHDGQDVEHVLLINRALDDLWWIHPDVKMVMASHTWCNRGMIKNLKQAYWMKEEVDDVEFKPVEADERAYSYDTDWFIMFYGDILD